MDVLIGNQFPDMQRAEQPSQRLRPHQKIGTDSAGGHNSPDMSAIRAGLRRLNTCAARRGGHGHDAPAATGPQPPNGFLFNEKVGKLQCIQKLNHAPAPSRSIISNFIRLFYFTSRWPWARRARRRAGRTFTCGVCASQPASRAPTAAGMSIGFLIGALGYVYQPKEARLVWSRAWTTVHDGTARRTCLGRRRRSDWQPSPHSRHCVEFSDVDAHQRNMRVSGSQAARARSRMVSSTPFRALWT